LNPGGRGGKPGTYRLSYGAANMNWYINIMKYFKICDLHVVPLSKQNQ
jgi:hypothetical protein